MGTSLRCSFFEAQRAFRVTLWFFKEKYFERELEVLGSIAICLEVPTCSHVAGNPARIKEYFFHPHSFFFFF